MEIQSIVAALGTVGGLVLWLLRRYVTVPRKIRKLKERVDDITAEIVSLEKTLLTSNDSGDRDRLLALSNERVSLNRRIRRFQGK